MVGQRGACVRLEIQEGCSSTLQGAAAGGCPQMRYTQRYLLDRRPVLPATVWRIRLVEPDTGCLTLLDRRGPPRHISDCYANVYRMQTVSPILRFRAFCSASGVLSPSGLLNRGSCYLAESIQSSTVKRCPKHVVCTDVHRVIHSGAKLWTHWTSTPCRKAPENVFMGKLQVCKFSTLCITRVDNRSQM